MPKVAFNVGFKTTPGEGYEPPSREDLRAEILTGDEAYFCGFREKVLRISLPGGATGFMKRSDLVAAIQAMDEAVELRRA